MNPFIKNCRTGFYDDILNRTSHYCKLLLTRTTIDNKREKNYGYLLDNNIKKQYQEKRLKSNEQLMLSLIKIQRKNSRYKSANENEEVLRKKSLKNNYLQRKKQVSISQGNIRLYKKILKADTQFSPQKLKQFDAKITKYSKIISHPYQQICQMDNHLFNTYRLQLYKNRNHINEFSNNSSDIKAVKTHKKHKKHKKLKRLHPNTMESTNFLNSSQTSD